MQCCSCFNYRESWVIFKMAVINHYYSCSQRFLYHISIFTNKISSPAGKNRQNSWEMSLNAILAKTPSRSLEDVIFYLYFFDHSKELLSTGACWASIKSLSLLTWVGLHPFKERKMSLGLGSRLTAWNVHFQSYENDWVLPSENPERNLISPLQYHNWQWCKIHSWSWCICVCTCSLFYMEKVPDKICVQ